MQGDMPFNLFYNALCHFHYCMPDGALLAKEWAYSFIFMIKYCRDASPL